MARPKTADTRERAIRAASDLLHEKGYLGVSMDSVANAIGVRKASLYHHFQGGKDELILEIAERLVIHDGSGFQRALDGHTSTRAQLEAMAAFVFEDRQRTERVLRDALRFMPEEHRRQIASRFYPEIFNRVLHVFEAGIERGELRPHDAHLSAWAFMGLMSELNEPQLHITWPDLSSRLVSLLLDGLLA
jgi:AcrR family transcriptional regulator